MLYSHYLLSGKFSVLIFIELGIQARGGGGRGPVSLTFFEKLQMIVALHLERERGGGSTLSGMTSEHLCLPLQFRR